MTLHVPVELGDRRYDIVVGEGLLTQTGALIAPLLLAPRVILISDANAARLYAERVTASLRAASIHVDTLEITPGEGSKSYASLEQLLENILALKPDRKTTLLALGGGVTGDLVGFAASVLLRGVPFIQLPTTLLAQVDSSVGGKTAINAKHGKNLIGSFYQPRLVIADSTTLSTLPIRERRAGYAEVVKYGLIMDAAFFRWCLAHGAAVVAGETAAVHEAVTKSCTYKVRVVTADEREAGQRALLNFGHTFAHALEAETGFSEIVLHGEAVAIGMVMAARLSARLGLISDTLEAELRTHLDSVGLPSSPKNIVHHWDVDRLMAHFYEDKKTEAGSLTFIVLNALGSARVHKQVDATLVRDIVKEFV